MNGIAIEYLLGIYFTVVSISWVNGKISADAVRLIAGVILLILAIIGKSFIS
jgi:putative Ca2+/H+ antiporter (TMEM165/GDT1 family)